MTRFQLILPVQSQKPPNFTPVIEWKNCSKHLIFCIYMAYKVIDIVFTQNTQILKITIFAIQDLRTHQKQPKESITQSQSSQFFYQVWYIFYVTWLILMSKRFRIYVGKGGKGSLRLSYGRPKLTLVSRFVAQQIRCYEKLTLIDFWSHRFETNRTWAPILGLHVLFVSK